MSHDELAPVTEFIHSRVAGDRDFEPGELAGLADELAGREELWRGLVHHSEQERIYVEIFRDHHVDAWLICWTGQQETGLHDHDVSGGAVRVIDGALTEDRLVFGHGFQTSRYDAGGGFQFDPSRIHDVRNADPALPSVSLHLYSPPLWRMGYYVVGEDGLIARRPANYADEFWSGKVA
jgi:hypothetical protein